MFQEVFLAPKKQTPEERDILSLVLLHLAVELKGLWQVS